MEGLTPELMAILKKSKAIDQAAKAYDTNPEPNTSSKRSSGGGLFDGVSSGSGSMMAEGFSSPERMDIESEMYSDAVKKSNLPTAIQNAMLNNPIPQPNGVGSVNEEEIRELRGEHFNEEDVRDIPDTKDLKRRPKKQMMTESIPQMGGISEDVIRKIVNEEIKKVLPKVLPKVVEHYIQKGLLKESMDILRNVKTTSVKKRG